MKRILVTVLASAVLAGCSSTQEMSFREASSHLWERTSSALNRIGEPAPKQRSAPVIVQTNGSAADYDAELDALFEQQYIDPLTDYLTTYANDEDRAGYLGVVREERDWRCSVIAARYANREPTRANLQRYRAGYQYSCPEKVSAFARRVAAAPAPRSDDTTATTQQAQSPGPAPPTPAPLMTEQLSECYLLTRISNFSAARKACRAPAEAGDTRSQANMAEIARTFENYQEALEWAQRAADESADAAYLLAVLYQKGHGVDQDRDTALKWYARAAALGHPDASSAVERQSAAAQADPDQ